MGHSLRSILGLLIFALPPNASWWQIHLINLARLFTLAILLRTYIAPWILAHTSRHVRVRSISLRSVRGLYLSYSTLVLRIERITYSYTQSRFTLKFEGVGLQVRLKPQTGEGDEPPASPATQQRQQKMFWTRPFKPLKYLLGTLARAVWDNLDPIIRPILRYWAMTLVRNFILFLPRFLQAFFIDVSDVNITFPDISGLTLVCGNAYAHAEVNITHLAVQTGVQEGQQTLSTFGSVRKSIGEGWKRTWNRVSSDLKGAAKLSIAFEKVDVRASNASDPILALPDALRLESSAKFIGWHAVEPQSVELGLHIGASSLNVDELLGIWNKCKKMFDSTPQVRPRRSLTISLPSPKFPSRESLRFNSITSPQVPEDALSPTSGSVLSPKSPLSPFLGAISASVLRARFRTIHPVKKLQRSKNPSSLVWLKTASFTISSLRVFLPIGAPNHEKLGVILKDLSFLGAVSHSGRHSVHRQTIGGHQPNPTMDSDCFILSLRWQEAALEWKQARLLTLGHADFSLFLSQWPQPWLPVTPFMDGDPNAALARAKGSLESIIFRLDPSDLDILSAQLLSGASSKTLDNEDPQPRLFDWPNVTLDLSCGEVHGLIIANEALALHLTTEGCEASLRTEYVPQVGKPSATSTSETPFGLDIRATAFTHPLQIIAGVGTIEAGTQLLTLASSEILLHGTGNAVMVDSTRNSAAVDPASLFMDVSVVSSGIDIHLDNPISMLVVSWLSSLGQSNDCPSEDRVKVISPPIPSRPLGTQLVKGLAANIACQRFAIFVGSPDLNGSDAFVGMSFTTSVSCQYAAVRAQQVSHFGNITSRSQTRHKLFLEEERLVDAISSAKDCVRSNIASAHGRINLAKVELRPAVFFPGRTPETVPTILSIPALHVDTVLSGNMITSSDQKCSITVRIPAADAKVSTWNLLTVLYALRIARRSPLSLKPSQPDSIHQHNSLVFVTDVILDCIAADFAPGGPIQLRLGHLSVNRLRWHRLLYGRDIQVDNLPGEDIAVQGEVLRFRIPSGFIFADLIRDVSVLVKACKHLVQTIPRGVLRPLDTPEAEGPKSVPDLRLSFGLLSFEVEDDPFESQLSLNWSALLDGAKHRAERNTAFEAKAATIRGDAGSAVDYHFTSEHTVSIADAQERLNQLHYLDHTQRLASFRKARQKRSEALDEEIYGRKKRPKVPSGIDLAPPDIAPALIRLAIRGLDVRLSAPSFPLDQLSEYLHTQGNGMPLNCEYSLLIPLHLILKFISLRITLRDYPYPLVDVPTSATDVFAAHFDSDIVIAEQMGTNSSVDWIPCSIVDESTGLHPLTFNVPKTIMPVKSFASPSIDFTTESIVRDMMRIIDTITSSPRDSSPPLGFWDKLRLVFHWTFKVQFKGGVQYHMKSSRDPYNTQVSGAGFALRWLGNTKLLIGQPNPDRELIQVISDTMLGVVPSGQGEASKPSKPFTKVCAKFNSGVRFGVGVVLERACGESCQTCYGGPFHRKCRLFHFKPHNAIVLEKKDRPPMIKSNNDSYNEFRSDFIHLSLSLTSSVRPLKPGQTAIPNSFHLTSKVFKHFWSWWTLFDNALSLPIRTGGYYPKRIISPKFTRHISTIKYRISLPNIYVMHSYIDDSRETWAESLTPWVGVKAHIGLLQVDMHQRDQEHTIPARLPGTTNVVHKKPFYAAELVMQDLDLRVLLAFFTEEIKATIPIKSAGAPFRKAYRDHSGLPKLSIPSSKWYDADDFIDMDWSCSKHPVVHLLPVTTCPRFTYFKKNLANLSVEGERSKFGKEDSHRCLLGEEPDPDQVALDLLKDRMDELEVSREGEDPEAQDLILKTISSIKQYCGEAAEQRIASAGSRNRLSFIGNGNEWEAFDHVYQVHFPRIFVDPAIRDVSLNSLFAVKYILDQAEANATTSKSSQDDRPSGEKTNFTATAIRKLLNVDSSKLSAEASVTECPKTILTDHTLEGFFEGVSRQRVHCCYLMKPQLVLRADHSVKDCCVISASQAKLEADGYMDDLNLEDPINGKIMSRIQTRLSGLQLFAPIDSVSSADAGLPPEVLIDNRFDSAGFVRLVPETDAEFSYDKFNRLRLRNKNVLVTEQTDHDQSMTNVAHTNHLRDQTDLVQVNIPQFTVTADDRHFQTISNLVSKLVLFADAHQKVHTDRLETLLFTYDFTDIPSVVRVVIEVQSKLRLALETARFARSSALLETDMGRKEYAGLRAHIQTLSEELNFLFQAIKLAQDKSTNTSDMASALLLKAWSSELSWRMLDDQKELLAKLVCKHTSFSWLQRQDSSTVNELNLGNLQAFDGSPDATWTEILSKQEDGAFKTHDLAKRNLFAQANWVILAPVGGITIYEHFRVDLHPLRLQVDAKVGVRIMEYLWPSRRARRQESNKTNNASRPAVVSGSRTPISRSSMDSPRTGSMQIHQQQSKTLQVPPLRRLGASRSFTDLRVASVESESSETPSISRTRSSEMLLQVGSQQKIRWKVEGTSRTGAPKKGDAKEMKTRSSQKSFVYVQISSLDLILSIQKDDSFVCRDARIQTRNLEYRNQTWSFEELVNQFIPADMSWKGWLKMAFHQPLVPVFPVARELFAKTKFLSAPKHSRSNSPASQIIVAPQRPTLAPPSLSSSTLPTDEDPPDSPSDGRGWRRTSRRNSLMVKSRPSTPTTEEPPEIQTSPDQVQLQRSPSGSGKKRVFGLFSRSNSSKTSRSSPSSNSSSPSLAQTSDTNGHTSKKRVRSLSRKRTGTSSSHKQPDIVEPLPTQ
ncbi:golgi-body localization protein domain-containing protein [Flagelloscypha sp. PMI_526]|nr:golgi-body localization protein domain-containing protein [Flagelloscypha sp. PMI_526]